MKRILLLTLISILVITGAMAAVSCGSSPAVTTAAPAQGITPAKPPGGQTPGPDLKSATISIDGFEFLPQSITVPPGTTVTWINDDPVAHTVVSDTGVFESPSLARGESFSFTFNEKGIYQYHCSPHPVMIGAINVE